MVAEMVVRIFEQLGHKHGNKQIELNIIAARVRTNGHVMNAKPQFIEEHPYRTHINEQITFAAMRRGVAHNNWSIKSFRFDSGLKYRPLQVCDLLSNASYRNFKNCSSSQKTNMKELLGAFDFQLNHSTILEVIERHHQEASLSHAIQTIIENWDRPDLDANVRQKIRELKDAILHDLIRMPASLRTIQLRQIVDWGSQFLELRDLVLADKILKWLEKNLGEPLLNSNANWFLAQILILRLGHHNHRGELSISRPICNRLHELYPKLAGHWEHASLMTEAMTLEAVHLNDCCEYDEATHLMTAVIDYYGELSSLMSAAMPGIFPSRVRSRIRGMALGTKLQSEMFAGLSTPNRLDKARQLSDMAFEEFSALDDQQRQYQYRCQIETHAGNFADARLWLAKSLGLKSTAPPTHNELSQKIDKLDKIAKGFALLHWSRIAMEAGRRGDTNELTQFCNAFKLKLSPWVMQGGQEYPAHGIRRHLAVLYAYAGKTTDSRSIIKSLRQLETANKEALELIKLSGCAEAAALWTNDNVQTMQALINDLNGFALKTAQFPALKILVNRLHKACKDFLASGNSNKQELLSICRLVGQ